MEELESLCLLQHIPEQESLRQTNIILVIGESTWKFVEPLPQPRLGKHNSVLVGLSVMDIFRTEVTL